MDEVQIAALRVQYLFDLQKHVAAELKAARLKLKEAEEALVEERQLKMFT